MEPRLLAGPALSDGAESFAGHRARLGPLPGPRSRHGLIDVVTASGLLGRGGAGFPVGRKWASVAGRSGGAAVVLVNGAEGEPLSAKDRTLMATRPHLILDGAELAADAVGADRIVLYVGREHGSAGRVLERAVRERSIPGHLSIDLVAAPSTYIAGEESAAVHFVDAGDARPTTTPPRPFERGIGGRPTLVQNVESLAHVALIARSGSEWYREVGGDVTRGTALVTVGAAARPGVTEIAIGAMVGEIADFTGAPADAQAVLLGGYFGGWVAADEAMTLALDPATLRAEGKAFGCGVVAFLPGDGCGVTATSRIMTFMAGQSAAQCGPCVFGLRAIADTTATLATRRARPADLERIERWAGQLAGRGACRHPDGAVGLLHSALRVFGDEFARHASGRGCRATGRHGRAA
jgi:NADH:ubiquinone oxidoreductase subunit F (NADH-binding)